MQNVINRYLGLLLLLCTASCSYFEARFDTLESFEEERNAYEAVVADIQQHRDDVGCFTSRCELSVEDIDIDEKWKSTFVAFYIISSKPLVIEFSKTDSIYTYIWYAETADSVKYMLSLPEVRGNELRLTELEEKWFLVTRDWN